MAFENTSVKSSREQDKTKLRKLTYAAMLTAIVVVLTLLGSSIRIGIFSINLSLVPIVVGAALLGPVYGGWFGLVNALVILLSGDAGLFWAFNPVGTVITVVLKGVLSGLAAGAVYALVSKKNKFAAVLLAAIVCPVVNTGIFVLGCYLFFWPYLGQIAEAIGVSMSSRSGLIFGVLVGLNFPTEVAVNVILAPAIARILGIFVDKRVSMIVYGGVLVALGVVLAILSVVFMKRALAAADPAAAQAIPARYIVMCVLSGVVFAGGAVLTVLGAAKRKHS
ncbi:MAG: ECF transporter S component [Oscillospiraceae bacterium]|nr:ECF transporter S component [Oscillospiraceae bacterium]